MLADQFVCPVSLIWKSSMTAEAEEQGNYGRENRNFNRIGMKEKHHS